MNTPAKKKRTRKRKCPHCKDFFLPDRRQVDRQKYCSKPECQKARQALNWRRWFSRPENRNIYGHEENVDRVREWRAANPGYWRRPSLKRNALPKASPPQPVDSQEDNSNLTDFALPKALLTQPSFLVGLMSHLTGNALPKDIAESARRFVLLGQDILGTGPGNHPKGDTPRATKTHPVSRASPPGSENSSAGLIIV